MAQSAVSSLGRRLFHPRRTAQQHEQRRLPPRGHRLAEALHSIPRAAALVAMVVGLLALVGAVARSTVLVSLRPGWGALDASTALGLLLAGAALWLLVPPPGLAVPKALGRALALGTGAIGFAQLVAHLYRLGDLVRVLDPSGWHAGRTQTSTSVALMLVSFALASSDTETKRHHRPAEVAAFATIALTLLAFATYAFGLTVLPARFTEMGLHAAAALFALSVGVLAIYPTRGWMGALSSRTPASAAVRRIALWALPAPLLIGAVVMGLVRTGGVEPLRAPALLAALATFAVGLALLTTSLRQHRGELERSRTEQRLHAQHEASRVLTATISLEDALPSVLAAVAESLAWDVGTIWRVDSGEGVLRCTHVWKRTGVMIDPFEEKTRQLTYAAGVGMPGRAWLTAEPVWNPDLTRFPSFRRDVAAQSGIRAGLAFPIRVGHRVIGVLELFRRTFADPDPELMSSVAVLGAQLGETIERKVAEERLRASEERIRLLLEGVRDYAIFMLDRRGVISNWNDAAEKITGFTAEEMVGRPFAELLPSRDGQEPGDALAAAAASGRMEQEGWTVRRDQTRFWANVVISALKDAQGAVSGYSAVLRDMTERKQVEDALRQARDEAEGARKELETFSYSVSHDLRAPLRSIAGFAQALSEDHAANLGPEGLDFLTRIRAASQKMSQLIDDLLKLSRTTQAVMDWDEVDLSGIALEVMAGLRAQDPKREVDVRIAEGIRTRGDARLLRVVLDNLIGNAWKFTARREHPIIEVGTIERAGERAYFVRDNGAGFDMSFVDRLFRPFERLHTDEQFPGSGIGLATVARVVQRHGGRVWAEGAPNEGATFYFTLGTSGREESRGPSASTTVH